ncbi:hypothetical protein BIU88_00560 [Chlorobaculum limnaeum]|uniref:Uncharacterized protein n=1 Tax=Chlorobaculum limnaeum TaxID=274537 RepID=A0A1D8CVB0_CHLLM|nr:hypothetical protein BIU88_00560 [Chlorobaculum limnaeum]
MTAQFDSAFLQIPGLLHPEIFPDLLLHQRELSAHRLKELLVPAAHWEEQRPLKLQELFPASLSMSAMEPGLW